MTMNALLSILVLLFPLILAHDNHGMDVGTDGATVVTEGHMLPYLHFTPGDTFWFVGWVPESKGAMVGACIGLFMLGLVDRWLAAIRASADSHWRKRAQIVLSNQLNYASFTTKSSSSSKNELVHRPSLLSVITLRSAPPFIPAHDIARGILHTGQAALDFALMLAVMTYQVSFILSIVIGLGVGETLFGRYISAAAAH